MVPGLRPDALDSMDKGALRELLAAKASEYGLGAVEVVGEDRAVLAQVVTRKFPGRTYAHAPLDLVDKALAGETAVSVADLGKNGEIVRTVVPAPGCGRELPARGRRGRQHLRI